MIEPRPPPCTPACGYQFHAIAVHPPPNLQYPQPDPHLESDWRSVMELFCGNKHCVKPVVKPFLHRSSVVDVWQNSKCDFLWGALCHWGYTREFWTHYASWFPWFTPNTRTIRWNVGLTPRIFFPLSRWDWKRVTNSRVVDHKSWMVRCSLRAPGF